MPSTVARTGLGATQPGYMPVELPRDLPEARRLAVVQSREPAAVVQVAAVQPVRPPPANATAGSQPAGNELHALSQLQPTASSQYQPAAPLQSAASGSSRLAAALPAGAGAFSTSLIASPSGSRATSSKTIQEPAPFRADPFALPANSSRPSRLAEIERDRVELPATDGGPTMEPAADAEGTGQPGGKQLEGIQSPQLTIQKTAPREIQVGKPAVFRLTVRNVGQVSASDVEVHDQVPKGTKLMSTTPRASANQRGELVWRLGAVRPGQETAVEMQVMPIAEGEIGSVATVHFGADASFRCLATRPQLALQVAAAQKVMIGEQLTLSLVVSNPGSGAATGVVVEERIPNGLRHPAGNDLEYEIGTLKPGESRKVDLPLTASRPGSIHNLLVVRGDGNLRAEDKRNIEVVAPALDVAMEGPKRRFLDREAIYQFSVKNPGTAAAKQIELVAYLPAGLKFVNANNAGSYDNATRSVRWRLEELPANEEGSVQLVTLPVEAGPQEIKLRGTAQKGLKVEKEQPITVEGIAAVLFHVNTSTNPIQVGSTTTYEVHVANTGSKASNNVRLAVELPPQLEPAGAGGPTRATADGSGRVIFDGLTRLAAKAETTYRIRVKALKAGDLRTRFQLQTDEMQSPITKEEATEVFGDE